MLTNKVLELVSKRVIHSSIILYLCLVLMGLRGGYGWGRLGVCGSADVPCCGVWVALELSCLATLLSLELDGSGEGILYDDIYIMITEK